MENLPAPSAPEPRHEPGTTTVRSDDEILDDVRFSLHRRVLHGTLATVRNGAVLLAGSVDSWSERRTAAADAAAIAGVRQVVNLLVFNQPVLAVQHLQMAVEDALARRALREARRLDLEIHNGRVTVSGLIGSAAERDAVVGALIGSRGVHGVNDELRLAGLSPPR